MKAFFAAVAFAFGALTLAPIAQAAPLSAAPAASVDVADAKVAVEPVTFRHRRHYRPYYGYSYYRPYPSYGLFLSAPARRHCWWHRGHRHCEGRSYW